MLMLAVVAVTGLPMLPRALLHVVFAPLPAFALLA
jgi:hypothetical protein